MQRNNTAGSLIFNYTNCKSWLRLWIIVLNTYINRSINSKYTSKLFIRRSYDCEKHSSVYHSFNVLKTQNFHSMIDSEDDDISQLAIQMLFNNYLDLYNKLDETGRYKYTLHKYPKLLTYYRDDWYKKYCYGH